MKIKHILGLSIASILSVGCASTEGGPSFADSMMSHMVGDMKISYLEEPSMNRMMSLSQTNDSTNQQSQYHKKVYLYSYSPWNGHRLGSEFPAFRGENIYGKDAYEQNHLLKQEVVKNATSVILQENGLYRQGFASSAEYKLAVDVTDYFSETIVESALEENLENGLNTGIIVHFTLTNKADEVVIDKTVKHMINTPIERTDTFSMSMDINFDKRYPYTQPEIKYTNYETKALQEAIQQFIDENLI
ncbi:hypothetical protein [Vibrio sp. SCSIO 43136]|uniref:hypothetical protein n=1 Tax=Vibrio sp. SCSIO 43136 TaxID=2819101 RepID=UPI002075D131|nr:hypothetical protein [Vibrio sp. SCSIO 43136]USD66228.1 hypothetical protein J4N39_05270 [Vibrio sp. SCSIO 43136]